MKRKFMWMGIGMVGTALFLAGCGDQKLEQTQQQLAAATNELAAARVETSTVKTQMQAKVDELQGTISKMTDEKVDTEKKIASLSRRTLTANGSSSKRSCRTNKRRWTR